MTATPLQISKKAHRRYILGAQGLWPGRRWRGRKGILKAIRQIEAVQMDPVTIVAPSHDIVLWGRVADYGPEDLDGLLYEERKLFDYGGNLNIYPVEELPYWKLIMESRKSEARWAEFAETNPDLIAAVLEAVKARGPTRKRDLGGEKIENYRGSKDTGLALYYLWLTGRLMSHSRVGRERVYDLTERVAPSELVGQRVPDEEARGFHLMKEISQLGLVSDRSFRILFNSLWGVKLSPGEAREKAGEYVERGTLAEVQVEGEKQRLYLSADRAELLDTVQKGGVPQEWEPLETGTIEEVLFLSPLERVSARGRAADLFDFEYTWEIYKPEKKRKYGPYTMPILFGERLVGRMDCRVDRDVDKLVVNGIWLEDGFEPGADFAKAFSLGLERFLAFLGATEVDAAAVDEKRLVHLFD